MIAIIPARGGSKGLPGKNIMSLCNSPLIAYTILAALNAKSISRVIVSTDSEEIANVAIKLGAECPFLRPSHLASDTASAVDVYNYTIDRLEIDENIEISEFAVLLPTSPLREASDIDAAVDLFINKGADSVISYCKELHPVKWHKYITAEGRFENIAENTLANRQMEKPSYFPNGAIYIFKKYLIETGSYYSDNSFAYIMDRVKSVDIDDILDFEYAEFLLKKKV